MDFLNVIIDNGNVRDTDRNMIFPKEELVTIIRPDNPNIKDVLDLLVILEAFPSKSQARKNWTGPIQFPPGWSEFWVGKRKRFLGIWNPTEK